ncbi:hypothetical protein A2U01_0114188, partial [Trifolium medium]|nr:hypothetical protein [Trifolium medium]
MVVFVDDGGWRLDGILMVVKLCGDG